MAQYRVICLMMAAGQGTRLEEKLPKQYQKLGGKEVLTRALEVFLRHPRVDAVQVVYAPEDQGLYKEAVEGLELLPVVKGGKTRAESVKLGLLALKSYQPEIVLIHDAARPFVSIEVIDHVLDAVAKGHAVIPVVDIDDTIKQCDASGTVAKTLDRNLLKRVQTPQAFHYQDILDLVQHETDLTYTDEAMLYEKHHQRVITVAGDKRNLKLTTQSDWLEAKQRIETSSSYEYRTGTGFDVHAFCEAKHPVENYVTLCGVHVPHAYSLAGHSDADVGMHALVDAILGAIGQGDIGEHFPPTDPTFKGMDSALFLKKAMELVQQAGAQLINADIILICEAPKISPYKQQMEKQLAAICAIEEERVNVKATTTEGLGFTGRKEGIAAQAVVTVRKIT